MRLLPREEKFFALFIQQVDTICEASQLLLDGLKGGRVALTKANGRIRDLEQKGDEITHDIFTRLNQTFITPLDPEDIHVLSSRLDDILDGIEDSSHRLDTYQVDPNSTIVDLCLIIDRSATAIRQAFHALQAKQPIMDHLIEVNRLEDEADNIVRAAIHRLFTEERDPVAIIKLKEIYEYLEATTDRCEDVADVLQSVVVKNS